MIKLMRLNIIAGITLFFAGNFTATSQTELVRQPGCDGNPFQSWTDSLRRVYGEQGYAILREASMTMESESEMPIVLPLTAGTDYQIIFIGDPTSRAYEMRMLDYSEKQVMYKKNTWGNTDGHIIVFNFVPPSSEYYMIKPMQVNRNKKKVCGYVLLLKK